MVVSIWQLQRLLFILLRRNWHPFPFISTLFSDRRILSFTTDFACSASEAAVIIKLPGPVRLLSNPSKNAPRAVCLMKTAWFFRPSGRILLYTDRKCMHGLQAVFLAERKLQISGTDAPVYRKSWHQYCAACGSMRNRLLSWRRIRTAVLDYFPSRPVNKPGDKWQIWQQKL